MAIPPQIYRTTDRIAVRAWIEKEQITDYKFAELIGRSPTDVSSWFRYHRPFGRPTLRRIHDLTGISRAVLLAPETLPFEEEMIYYPNPLISHMVCEICGRMRRNENRLPMTPRSMGEDPA